jgi:hypothetical protein
MHVHTYTYKELYLDYGTFMENKTVDYFPIEYFFMSKVL